MLHLFKTRPSWLELDLDNHIDTNQAEIEADQSCEKYVRLGLPCSRNDSHNPHFLVIIYPFIGTKMKLATKEAIRNGLSSRRRSIPRTAMRAMHVANRVGSNLIG